MLKWFSKSAWTYDAQTGEEAEQTVTAALEDGKSALTLRPEKYLNIQSASLTIGSGGVTLAQGGAIRSQCVLYFDRDPEAAGENVFAGAVTISGQRGRVEVNDGLTIASTGSVVSSAEHRNFGFEVYGGLTVDFTGRLVYIDGKRVDMTPKEYDLFFYLVKNKGIALTREKLINEVWGYDFYGDDRTLDTHIKLLRKSLGEYSGTITTLRGVGYRFEGC